MKEKGKEGEIRKRDHHVEEGKRRERVGLLK
jgi:hypothetical protein